MPVKLTCLGSCDERNLAVDVISLPGCQFKLPHCALVRPQTSWHVVLDHSSASVILASFLKSTKRAVWFTECAPSFPKPFCSSSISFCLSSFCAMPLSPTWISLLRSETVSKVHGQVSSGYPIWYQQHRLITSSSCRYLILLCTRVVRNVLFLFYRTSHDNCMSYGQRCERQENFDKALYQAIAL